MSSIAEYTGISGEALSLQEETSSCPVYTIEKYLYGCVNIDVPIEAICKICIDREVDKNADALDIDKTTRDLLKADLLVWLVLGVSRRSAVSDTDNGWNHSDGGYTLNESDKKTFLNIANKIYSDNGEETVGKTKAKILSHGIMPANRDTDGGYLPRFIE